VALVAALRPTISDGIYDRRHPGRTAAGVTGGVVRILAGWGDPGDRLQTTAGDSGQHVARIGKVDIVGEVGPGACSATGAADVTDRVWSRPDRALTGRVISPG